MTNLSDYHSGKQVDSLAPPVTLRQPWVGSSIPGLAVSILLQWCPITVLLTGNAVLVGLTSVQNTEDRAAVKDMKEKLTHKCVECCSGTGSRYLGGE